MNAHARFRVAVRRARELFGHESPSSAFLTRLARLCDRGMLPLPQAIWPDGPPVSIKVRTRAEVRRYGQILGLGHPQPTERLGNRWRWEARGLAGGVLVKVWCPMAIHDDDGSVVALLSQGFDDHEQ